MTVCLKSIVGVYSCPVGMLLEDKTIRPAERFGRVIKNRDLLKSFVVPVVDMGHLLW